MGTLLIEPRSPWDNGYVESFNGKLRDELLDGEISYTLKQARVLIESGGGDTTTVTDRTARWGIYRRLRKRRC